MLVIDGEHLSAVGKKQAERFYTNLGKELRVFMTLEFSKMDDDEAYSIINEAFQLSMDHGFETEVQITQLCYILVTFPLHFGNYPEYQWLSGLLQSQGSANTRLNRIKSCIRA